MTQPHEASANVNQPVSQIQGTRPSLEYDGVYSPRKLRDEGQTIISAQH